MLFEQFIVKFYISVPAMYQGQGVNYLKGMAFCKIWLVISKGKQNIFVAKIYQHEIF